MECPGLQICRCKCNKKETRSRPPARESRKTLVHRTQHVQHQHLAKVFVRQSSDATYELSNVMGHRTSPICIRFDILVHRVQNKKNAISNYQCEIRKICSHSTLHLFKIRERIKKGWTFGNHTHRKKTVRKSIQYLIHYKD